MSNVIDIESKININIYDPDFNDLKSFKLILHTNNKKIYKFFKKTKEKFCKIIDIFDEIELEDINLFELIIYNSNIQRELINIVHKVKKDNDFEYCYVYKDDEIYLEFLKENKYISCVCYLKKISNNLLFNTPPNY